MEIPRAKISLKQKISLAIKTKVITIGWKILHILLANWEQKLEAVSNTYLEKTWTKLVIDKQAEEEIEKLREYEKWIIILNHSSSIFSDYLPLFAILKEPILKKILIYTWSYNLEMNKKEFLNYEFRSWTIKERRDIIELKKQIKEDVENIENNGWYIFIIPSWSNINIDADFWGIFLKMIKWINPETPVLVNHVEHEWDKQYLQIAKNLITKKWWESRIKTKLTFARDWKWKTWKESRRFYNSIFWIK